MRTLATIILILLCGGIASAAEAEARLPRARYKNGADVRAAFHDVVAAAGRATVRISCDGKPVSLGAVIDADGGILSKASQLSGKITCRLRDGRDVDARLVGVHEKLDLAYLKVDAKNLPVIEWDRGTTPDVGQWLATAGWLEEIPVAVGVVSVQRRRLPEQKGMLGITAEDAGDQTPGARIQRVLPQSAAETAGLKVGDIIHHVAGAQVANLDAMAEAIGRHEPGETIELRITRGAEQLAVRATLGHPTPEVFSRGGFMNHLGGRLSRRRSGFPPVLQHDTVLSPEECGGPVVSLSGKVAGINIARAGRTETYALTAEMILPVLGDLRSGRLAPREVVPPPEPSAPRESGPAPPPLPEN